MLRIAVCDDHNAICSQVESYVVEVCREQGIKCKADTYNTGEELCQKLSSNETYDLIFLDIEIAELSGVDVGNIIRNEYGDVLTQIAYISSKAEYAMELFKIHPIDFLIKPLKHSEVERIITKVLKINGKDSDVFSFKQGNDIQRVKVNSIIYLESIKRKIHIFTENGAFEFYGTLEQVYNEQLKNYSFLHIHKSFMVNPKYVGKFAYESVIMTSGKVLVYNFRNNTLVFYCYNPCGFYFSNGDNFKLTEHKQGACSYFNHHHVSNKYLNLLSSRLVIGGLYPQAEKFAV